MSARIAQWGTEAQRRRYLPGLASGELLAASAWSETGAGASKKKLATTAERTPAGWVLDGAKSFTTGAGLADVYLVLAQTEEVEDNSTSYGSAGQSFFLVDSSVEGVVADLGLDLVGMRASATGFVQLRQARVPHDALFGPIGEARKVIASVRESGVTLGAVASGVAQAAYDAAMAQASKRGLGDAQAIRHRLVDLRVQVEAARAIVERAGRRDAADPGMTTLYSKLFASATAEQVCMQAARLLGSGGFVAAHPVNRYLRDARAVALMGPTDELCRELVSQAWL
ncbi:MAG: acyl-CoA dehydrogenase [Actinobacteria bacterium 13_2_20CM_2_71_6]|nr:MAG: acyl-CoA dehydrogenase [Actinobacteria bacterium 13_2_20CM_2_71_6]